ncbi:hypothetical protein FQN49_008111 [Arthroderma sp. PD_2]|nr:hypothetical protein FQN49_008111 [Arthroderma sp. PD_2]
MATQLVPLAEVERLSASVIRILGGNPGKYTLQGTNTYLLGRGPTRLLIDTGEGKPSWSSALQQTLTSERATVSHALLTHWHHDHVGGVRDLRGICPGVQVYKHNPEKGEGQSGIEDGQVFSVVGATVRALHTPGHTRDHIAFLMEEEEAMFTGDNVLGHGTTVFEELKTYMVSLEKMGSRASANARGYPGHGAVIENCKSKIAEYIRHRQQREDEILRVLKYGSLDSSKPGDTKPSGWTPIELVKVIYADVPESLHLPASHGVIQVLGKLEDEGKVTHDEPSGRWAHNARRPAL